MGIGGRVRASRKAEKLSQEGLARRADVSLNVVSRLERGEIADPHISTLTRIANALGMQVSTLLESEGEPNHSMEEALEADTHEKPGIMARVGQQMQDRETKVPEAPENIMAHVDQQMREMRDQQMRDQEIRALDLMHGILARLGEEMLSTDVFQKVRRVVDEAEAEQKQQPRDAAGQLIAVGSRTPTRPPEDAQCRNQQQGPTAIAKQRRAVEAGCAAPARSGGGGRR